jgi:hypothetical protein
MPRTRKIAALKPTRAELEAERDRLYAPLRRPRPWLKDCNRDPRIAAILLRQAEAVIVLR